MTKHNRCGLELARINGRSLRQALKATGSRNRFGRFEATDWIEVCPLCDAVELGIDTPHPWPILCSDGYTRTALDFKKNRSEARTRSLDFCGFGFSISALESGILLSEKEDKKTSAVEKLGSSLERLPSIEKSIRFSKEVCDWGRGSRVWGNLRRHNKSDREFGQSLARWFRVARKTMDDEEAILPGTKIAGLNVSFASKHLRMIDPTRYAVLDGVLTNGLGFANNPKGYKLFLRLLRNFHSNGLTPHNLAKLEGGIFILVRQVVRSKGLFRA